MSVLTPEFGSTRMLRQYVDVWLPQAETLRTRLAKDCALAKSLHAWSRELERHWRDLHIGQPAIARAGENWRFSVPVFLGEIAPQAVQAELFADADNGRGAEVVTLHREQPIPGTLNGFVFAGEVPAARAAEDYTVRIVPSHEQAHIPAELPLIRWQR